MAQVEMTATVDTSNFQKVLPEFLAFSKRTMKEQCVTSMGMILRDAQQNTPAVSIGRMDQELDAPAIEVGNKSAFAKKNKLGGLQYTEGMMIAVQRMNPNSVYSKSTGNRWPIMNPGFTGQGKQQMLWRFLQAAAERMKAARHSSGHFLQAGFKNAIWLCESSPFYKNRYRAKDGGGSSSPNPLNTLDASKLGNTKIQDSGDSVTVVGQNNVGDLVGKTNSTLAATHRDALIAICQPLLEHAVQKETGVLEMELEKRMMASDGIPKFNRMLS